MKETVTFRWLAYDEFSKVAAIFTANDWALPDPRQGAILIGEDEGRIVACYAMQSILHIGPAWIDEAYRHSGFWRGPMETLRDSLESAGHNGIMLVAMNPATEHIAEFLGMKRSQGVLFLRDFGNGGE